MGLTPQLKPGLSSRLTGETLDNSRTLLANAYESWLEHIQPVSAPLALISQIQRSGGSMLSQLFDGHPQVHAHPHELKFGYPKKYIWPPIDLGNRPDRWFEILFEDLLLSLKKRDQRELISFSSKYLI